MSKRTFLLLLLVLVLLLPTTVGDHDRGKDKGAEKDHSKGRDKDRDEDTEKDDEPDTDGGPALGAEDGKKRGTDEDERRSTHGSPEEKERGAAMEKTTPTTPRDSEAVASRVQRESREQASSEAAGCEGFVSLHSGKDGVIEVAGAPEGTILLRARGDDEATPVHRFEAGRDTWADHNTSVGKTYTYVVVQDGHPCARMETTAVPFFPHPAAAVAAAVAGVALFALLGHRRPRSRS